MVNDFGNYDSLPELPTALRVELNQARSFSGDQEEAYVIIVWNEIVLEHYLKSQPTQIIRNTRATYLILFVEHYDNTCIKNEQFGKILPMIWHEFKVLNMITLAPCSCNPRIIFKYDPFFYDNSTMTWGLIKHRTLSEARANPFRVINTLRSLKGMTLNVTLFERTPSAVKDLPETMIHYDCMHTDLAHGFSGFDGCVLGNMAYYLNFVVNIVDSSDYGYQLSNGTYIGSLAHVVYKKADFAANSRFMTALDTRNIEYTTPVTNDVACFIVPMPKRMPQWVMIFRCFKIETWLVIFIMMIVLALCFNFGRRIDFYNRIRAVPLANDLVDVFGISVGQAVPTPTSIYHQRVILASCMIFNVIVAGIFQGSLFNSFSRIVYYPRINTLQELYDSGLPIATSVDVFQDGKSEILKKLKSRRVYLSEKAINRSAYRRDIVAVERRQDAFFLIQTKFVSDQGVPMLHVVPECPSSYFLAYAVQKNSPFLPRFNDLLTRFLESGLINKWYRDTLYGFIMRKKIHTKVLEQIQKAFNFEDVQTAFYLLALGIIFAFVIFVFEVIFAGINSRFASRKAHKNTVLLTNK